MKIVVIGASGTIGAAVVAALSGRHDVISVSRTSGDYNADIQDKASLEKLFASVGPVDAVISTAGGGAFKPLEQLSDADFAHSLNYKLMGQVNVIRTALAAVQPNGVIIVSTGVLAQEPMPAGSAISMINSGLEGFVRGAAIDLKGKVRINAVSPPWVSETLVGMGQDGADGMPAADVAKAYVQLLENDVTGQVLDARTVR